MSHAWILNYLEITGRVHFICRGSVSPQVQSIVDYIKTNYTKRVTLEISTSRFFPDMVFVEFTATDGPKQFIER